MEVNSFINYEVQKEEDVDCFFLQPSSSPYNITEKVQQANTDLFSSTNLNIRKIPKVKFKDDLFSFEPDLTDEDVNSIESDPVEGPDNSTLCEYKTVNISQIDEVTEDFEEEIIESINFDFNEIVTNYEKKIVECTTKEQKSEKIKIDNITTNKKSAKKKKNESKNLLNIKEVYCKDHCIDRLDFDLPMYIKKLEIHEKPNNLPPLQLLQRKCCDELRQKVQRNLPTYNGLKSEYGLTLRQIDTKRKQKEILKLEEANRKKILEEYKKRKIQQNEEVFSQWLKEISKRQEKDRQRRSGVNQVSSPSVISFSNKNAKRIKERPKTANDIVPKNQLKKLRRPHTTTCVFIEMPQTLLKKGINIGNLLVTNSNFISKKLHILAVS